ncbi:flavin reductase (DIM6/NTAB) family NADH-FMN oxidoreductase RutF [Rhodococcus sp. OK519]|uniref:flavin reductase family protein n=1 Tax=Rhodococcus sp. OK519 TaxID=2135729 RepID=UPI000D3D8471|nr:flavin reductase (DIM6/NTAB) family NADH-FMN oxidoreductase RutF [Rhodococcus sp. OK519]
MTTAAPTTRLGDRFRHAFRGHPAGVAIITALGRTGPVGITSSSVASVSADPAVLGFSLQSLRGSAAEIGSARSLLVHLLTADNLALARRFATSDTDRFGVGTAWSPLDSGEPLLEGTGTVLRCSPLTRTEVGSALVVTAAVDEVRDAASLAAPLVYQDRAYHCVSAWTVLP